MTDADESSPTSRAYHTYRMRTELRRGGLVMAVLAALKTEHYGYSLRKRLLEVGIDIDEGTLYPLIRRLETQGLLESDWRETDGRKRRYYRISADGQWALDQLRGEWDQMVGSLRDLLGGEA